MLPAILLVLLLIWRHKNGASLDVAKVDLGKNLAPLYLYLIPCRYSKSYDSMGQCVIWW